MQQRAFPPTPGFLVGLVMCLLGSASWWLACCVASPGDAIPTNSSSQAIIGGNVVPQDELPAVVSLSVAFGGTYCTATIIGPTYALTAAHCVYEIQAETLRLITANTNGMVHSGTSVHLHPDYTPTVRGVHDIAVVEFSPATDVAPALLQRTKVELGTTALFAGYGYTTPRSSQDDTSGELGVLHKYSKPIASCESWAADTGRDLSDDRQFCIPQQDGTGTCSGDSGGPAFIDRDGNAYLAGVTSYGDIHCRVFGVSSRVEWYADFIDDATYGTLPDAYTGDAAERERKSGCSSGGSSRDMGSFLVFAIWLSPFAGQKLRRRRAGAAGI